MSDRPANNRYEELKQLGDDFLAAFNNADVDAIMAFFSDDAVYEELHGKIRTGKEEIRKSFSNLFSGRFGQIRFDEDDTFIDERQNKVMSSWYLHIELDGRQMVLEGLDLLHFEGDKLHKKLTLCKAKEPLYQVLE